MKNFIKKVIFILPKGQGSILSFILFLTILHTILELVGIGLIIPFLSLFFEDTNLQIIESFEFINKLEKNQKIIFVLFLLLIVFILKNYFLVVTKKVKINFSHQLSADLARKFYEKYIYKNFLYFSKKNTANIIRNITAETGTFSLGIVLTILNLISDSLIFISIVIFLFFYNFVASLIITLTMSIFAFIVIYFQKKKLKEWGKIRLLHTNSLVKLIQETFGNIKETILSNNYDYFLSKFKYHTEQNKISGQKKDFYFIIPRPILEVFIILMTIILIYYFTKNNYLLSEIFIIIGVISFATLKLLPSTISIMNGIQGIKYNSKVVEILFNDLSDIADEDENKNKINTSSQKKNIKFEKIKLENVSFGYPDKSFLTLKNINLVINKNDKIGLLGETGSGKTTLINLISGLISPSEGNINFFENSKEKKLQNNLLDWQNTLGYVSQNIYLADQTFLFNITFKNLGKSVDQKKVDHLLKILNLKNLIENQEDGINTKVGERGIKLSGGQIQRIGIARALYSEPEILILDEATNSLDESTEKVVLDSIFKEMENKTIISISHNIKSLNYCNKIYKVEEGQLIEL